MYFFTLRTRTDIFEETFHCKKLVPINLSGGVKCSKIRRGFLVKGK